MGRLFADGNNGHHKEAVWSRSSAFRCTAFIEGRPLLFAFIHRVRHWETLPRQRMTVSDSQSFARHPISHSTCWGAMASASKSSSGGGAGGLPSFLLPFPRPMAQLENQSSPNLSNQTRLHTKPSQLAHAQKQEPIGTHDSSTDTQDDSSHGCAGNELSGARCLAVDKVTLTIAARSTSTKHCLRLHRSL